MNLQKMVKEITSAGMSQDELASICEVHQSTISLIAGGRTPRYDIGKRIEEAHKRIMRSVKRKQARENQK